MRINPLVAPLAMIIILLGAIFGANQVGLWSTSGRTSVNLQNLTALDIKGWMTLQQISDGMGLPVEQVRYALNVPMSAPNSTAMKDLEKMIPGFETSHAREILGKSMSVVLPTPTIAPTEQPFSVDQIKGGQSIKQVAEQANVQMNQLLDQLNLAPDTDVDLTLKALISQGKLSEVTQVRDAITALQNRR
jgi:hypothetical protein